MGREGKYPYFPFYPDDFASDGIVEAMTTEAVGAYILLLCKAWREDPPGTIPDNDVVLARWARLTPERWTECKPMVMAAFLLGKDKRWHQKRLRKEYIKLCDYKRSKVEAGKAGASKRWHSDSTAIDVPLAKDAIEPELELEPTEKNNTPKPPLRGDGVSFPGFNRFWSAWPNHSRKANKKACLKTWETGGLEELTDAILASLTQWKRSHDWSKDGGQYIPAPLVWLGQRRFEVSADAIKPAGVASGDDWSENHAYHPTAAEASELLRGLEREAGGGA